MLLSPLQTQEKRKYSHNQPLRKGFSAFFKIIILFCGKVNPFCVNILLKMQKGVFFGVSVAQ